MSQFFLFADARRLGRLRNAFFKSVFISLNLQFHLDPALRRVCRRSRGFFE